MIRITHPNTCAAMVFKPHLSLDAVYLGARRRPHKKLALQPAHLLRRAVRVHLVRCQMKLFRFNLNLITNDNLETLAISLGSEVLSQTHG